MRIASCRSPARQALCIEANRRGATLAVTEMQPSPDWANRASAVASSPDRIAKSGPQARRVASGRSSFAVASLTPAIWGSFASSAMVPTVMSITERGGML